jgi:REP element-mobilizing transposase RayT
LDRYWFLTWTTYGNWLPGDPRGFVGKQRNVDGSDFIHNHPGTPYDADVPPLQRAMREAMKGEPIRLDREQAATLISQFQEMATFRGWLLLAIAVMTNHVHLVVGVPGDPEPEQLLHDFKSYGSRALNRRWGKPLNGTWWTESGSKRKLANEANVAEVVCYVRDQEFPLLVWVAETLASGGSYASGSCQTPGA